MTKKLKVRMHPFQLKNIRYKKNGDFEVHCHGLLAYNEKYRQRLAAKLGTKYSKYFWPVAVSIVSPYGFNGGENKIEGSKQAKYALQLLMEACPPCILVT